MPLTPFGGQTAARAAGPFILPRSAYRLISREVFAFLPQRRQLTSVSSRVFVVKLINTPAVVVFYHLYQKDDPLISYQLLPPKKRENHEAKGYRGNHVGYIHVNDIPPPRTVQRLSRCIALLEGFTAVDIKDIFLCFNHDETLVETTRLNLAPGAPGTDPEAPIEVVIDDNAKRARFPARTKTLYHMTRAQMITAKVPPSMKWWIVSKDSSPAKPIPDPENPELIMASPEIIRFAPPPGWTAVSLRGRQYYTDDSDRPKLIDRSDVVYSAPLGLCE
ncbi:hypothetical protein DL93DRAFT_1707156 [Clavulina sp. PMI_390]|nr:hypothetical protein DL93DRAFT_1707156 [Clavulina sp. PMI_390]